MNGAVFPILFEAALRALAAAIVIWAALLLLCVQNVRTQKTAWTLMLMGALAMPLLMRWQWLPVSDAIEVPSLSRVFAPATSWLRAVVHPATAMDSGGIAPAADPAPAPPPLAWSDRSSADRGAAAKNTEDKNYSATDLQDSFLMRTVLSAPIQHDSVAPLPAAARPSTAAESPATQTRPANLLDLAWLFYLAVAVALLVRLIAGLASALHMWMTADPVLAPTIADLVPAGAVRWSPRVTSPVNFGSGIVLPADYGEWSEEKLRVVLAHERVHVRQGDFYLQLLAGLYAALVWFSPLGWWLRRKLSELGEAMGDRAGLKEAASPSSYAQVLLEFAALPRPTRTGVAMARTGHLASRIERLLDDATFLRAFARSGRRRAALALVIAPLALLASAVLVRVQAASQTPAPAQQAGQAQMVQASQETGVSNPPEQTITDQSQEQPAPAPLPNPAEVPNPSPAPEAVPAPPAPPAPGQVVVPPVPPVHVQVPPIPPIHVEIPSMPQSNAEINKALRMQMEAMGKDLEFNFAYLDSEGGDLWALVNGPGEPKIHGQFFAQSSGNAHAEIDEARKTAHVPFFWFKHKGKSYVVEDPSVVAQIEALEKAKVDLRSQMRALGKQQRELGEQWRQQMRQQRRAAIPKPDLSKQMADLNAAVDSLKAGQGDTITRDQLMKLQAQITKLQTQLFQLESGLYRQNGAWGAAMGEFGKQEGELGAEQGRLAGEMAGVAMANRGKIDAIIKQSLSDGKAKPVN